MYEFSDWNYIVRTSFLLCSFTHLPLSSWNLFISIHFFILCCLFSLIVISLHSRICSCPSFPSTTLHLSVISTKSNLIRYLFLLRSNLLSKSSTQAKSLFIWCLYIACSQVHLQIFLTFPSSVSFWTEKPISLSRVLIWIDSISLHF